MNNNDKREPKLAGEARDDYVSEVTIATRTTKKYDTRRLASATESAVRARDCACAQLRKRRAWALRKPAHDTVYTRTRYTR